MTVSRVSHFKWSQNIPVAAWCECAVRCINTSSSMISCRTCAKGKLENNCLHHFSQRHLSLWLVPNALKFILCSSVLSCLHDYVCGCKDRSFTLWCLLCPTTDSGSKWHHWCKMFQTSLERSQAKKRWFRRLDDSMAPKIKKSKNTSRPLKCFASSWLLENSIVSCGVFTGLRSSCYLFSQRKMMLYMNEYALIRVRCDIKFECQKYGPLCGCVVLWKRRKCPLNWLFF